MENYNYGFITEGRATLNASSYMDYMTFIYPQAEQNYQDALNNTAP